MPIKSIGVCRPLSSLAKTNFSSGQFVYDPVTSIDSNMSVEPFKRLVKLAARAFYDDALPKGDNQQKTGRSDNKGIAVVILDALTRRQWVREEDLAKDLKLHTKQLRRTLRFFEEEKLITRDHRKETAKGAKIHNFTVAATGDGYHNGREDEKIKMHTHSYCCLDYAQTYDVIRYRLHRMKKKLKDELDDKDKVQEYICPNCQRRYTALDAGRLVSMDDYDFHCEACNGVLVPESEKLPVQDVGDADENARRRNRNLLQDMLHKMEVQLKPLNDQLNLVKDLGAPEFGTLQAWEARANALRVNGDPSSDLSTTLHGRPPMPYIGETKVEVAIFGTDGKGDVKSENGTAPMKVLPPWMIKQGMNITDEQRGEVKGEIKMDGYSRTAVDSFEEKKSVPGLDEEEKNVQDEYLKAYYAAFYKRQSEQEEADKNEQDNLDPETKGPSLAERQVGGKSKREDDNDGADVVWEEAPAGNTSKHYKVNDLNMEAGGSSDEEEEGDDEDIWEEG